LREIDNDGSMKSGHFFVAASFGVALGAAYGARTGAVETGTGAADTGTADTRSTDSAAQDVTVE
jgi:hypothetical protein